MREAIARYGHCLPQLKPRQRRVLRLRAGVGEPPPASRARVARLLDLSVRSVRRAERHGLRALERMAAGGCGASAPAAADTGSFTFVDFGGGTMTAGDPRPAVQSGGSTGGSDTAGVGEGTGGPDGSQDPGGSSGGGDDGSSAASDGRGGVKGVAATRAPPAGSSAVDLTLPLLLVIVLGAAAAGAWRLRRSARDAAS